MIAFHISSFPPTSNGPRRYPGRSLSVAMKASLYLGLDFGTSGARATVIDGASQWPPHGDSPHHLLASPTGGPLTDDTYCPMDPILPDGLWTPHNPSHHPQTPLTSHYAHFTCIIDAGDVVADVKKGYGDGAEKDWALSWDRSGAASLGPALC